MGGDPGSGYGDLIGGPAKANLPPGGFGGPTGTGRFGWNAGGQQVGGGGGFNQSQQNYIGTQGKLPGAFGGTALNQGQQNFFNTKGYLPGGVQGTFGGKPLGNQFYKQQQQYPVNAGQSGGPDLSQVFQQMFGYGGAQGNNLWGGGSGYGNFKLF